MAKTTQPTYDRKAQQAILDEADQAVQKTLAAIMKKYPGAILGHHLSITVPAAPLTVEHSGVTRPLAAKDATVPAPDHL